MAKVKGIFRQLSVFIAPESTWLKTLAFRCVYVAAIQTDVSVLLTYALHSNNHATDTNISAKYRL
jgi:hypothetical protein